MSAMRDAADAAAFLRRRSACCFYRQRFGFSAADCPPASDNACRADIAWYWLCRFAGACYAASFRLMAFQRQYDCRLAYYWMPCHFDISLILQWLPRFLRVTGYFLLHSFLRLIFAFFALRWPVFTLRRFIARWLARLRRHIFAFFSCFGCFAIPGYFALQFSMVVVIS